MIQYNGETFSSPAAFIDWAKRNNLRVISEVNRRVTIHNPKLATMTTPADLPPYGDTRIEYKRYPTAAIQAVELDGIRLYSIDVPSKGGEVLWYGDVELYQLAKRATKIHAPTTDYEAALLEAIGPDGLDSTYYYLNALASDQPDTPTEKALGIAAIRLRKLAQKTRDAEDW